MTKEFTESLIELIEAVAGQVVAELDGDRSDWHRKEVARIKDKLDWVAGAPHRDDAAAVENCTILMNENSRIKMGKYDTFNNNYIVGRVSSFATYAVIRTKGFPWIRIKKICPPTINKRAS